MDALIGTYEDEWRVAVQDPELRASFKQFVNTVIIFHPRIPFVFANPFREQDERRPAIELIEERGQTRAADWPKSFPAQKFHAEDLPTPKSEWKWIALASVSDLHPTEENTTCVPPSLPFRKLTASHCR